MSWCSGCSPARCSTTLSLRWWHALIWAGGLRLQFRQLPVDRAGIRRPRLSMVAINLLALGFIVLALVQTIDVLVGRPGRRPPPAPGLHRHAPPRSMAASMRSCRSSISGGDAAEIVNAANAAMLAGIVAAISVAMMRVDGARSVSGRMPRRRQIASIAPETSAARSKAGRRADAADGG